ncbi:MAG: aldehyde ferredoxin oxidoreductase N-terminal domain-containing protein [Dehalococcoidia bacterium]
MTEYGYAGNILKINLSDNYIEKTPAIEYSERFLGGHGIAAKLYWDMVPPRTRAHDEDNALICASGPVCGFPGFAGFRWKVCGKSAEGDRESFNYCNLGERWGAFLKFAGYDALTIRGKAEKPTSIFIDGSNIEFKDASSLWGKSTFDVIDILKEEYGKNVSILTIGPAAENLVPYSTIFTDAGASGSGGLGVVMGSKKLKAIIIALKNRRPKAAHPDKLKELAEKVQIMRPPADMPSMWEVPELTRNHSCYGCGIGCGRQIYNIDGRRYKSLCQASVFYANPVMRYSGKVNGARLLATRLCDGYGIDTAIMHGMVEWIDACQEAGLMTEKQTGLPLKKVGSPEFINVLTGMITNREGFGEALSRGTIAAAREIGPEAEKMLHLHIATRGSETKDYDPRLMLSTSLIYATEPRRPIQQLHGICSLVMAWLGMGDDKPGRLFKIGSVRKTAEKYWGSAIAADFSTLEGKALAAKKVQDRCYAKESLVLCDLRWPGMVTPEGPGDPSTESQIYSAITGKDTDEAELNKTGERILNLQRAILLRQGWQGRRDDQLLDYYHTEPLQKGEIFWNDNGLVPGKNGKVTSKIGTVVDRDDFEKLKDEYYELRGWDVESGFLTEVKMADLGLEDIALDLKSRGLLK